MRELKFTKMQSLGNDFVMLDSVTEDIRITEDIARNIASRRFGIGCDQLIVAESGEVADLRMRIFNTDGSEVGQCGNGARCFAAFVHDRGLVGARVFDVETITTKLKLEIGDDGFVAVGCLACWPSIINPCCFQVQSRWRWTECAAFYATLAMVAK